MRVIVFVSCEEYYLYNDFGIKTVDELVDDFADVIISSPVLEHDENSLGELRRLKRILKPGGEIVFQVPNKSSYIEYVRSDENNHLYT